MPNVHDLQLQVSKMEDFIIESLFKFFGEDNAEDFTTDWYDMSIEVYCWNKPEVSGEFLDWAKENDFAQFWIHWLDENKNGIEGFWWYDRETGTWKAGGTSPSTRYQNRRDEGMCYRMRQLRRMLAEGTVVGTTEDTKKRLRLLAGLEPQNQEDKNEINSQTK